MLEGKCRICKQCRNQCRKTEVICDLRMNLAITAVITAFQHFSINYACRVCLGKKDRPSSFSQSVIIVVLQVPAETLSANWAKVAAASS